MTIFDRNFFAFTIIAVVAVAGFVALFAVAGIGVRDDTARRAAQPGEATVDAPTEMPSRDELRTMGLGPMPPVTMPADNPTSEAKVELGKMLFFDPRMSGDGAVSCATCHGATLGWGDGNALSLGYPGTLHWRNSQTIINSAHHPKLFWAGESKSLEAQAKSAFTGNVAGNLDPVMAEERLRQMPEYVRRFNEVFGADSPSFDDALRAVAAFEATIVSRNVPFDRYMEGNDSAMPEPALRGLGLFVGKAGCIECHGGPLFTDQSFHNTGVPPNAEFESSVLRQITLRYQHRARGVPESVYRTADRDLGLYYTTKQEVDKGKFRTPTVREAGQTGPYMHNGVFKTLHRGGRLLRPGRGRRPGQGPAAASPGSEPAGKGRHR